MAGGNFDYAELDRSGEALAAAERMELRAREPASEVLFRTLVAPLLGPETKRVLEVGCGTAALSRRIAAWQPGVEVFATDKSAGMLSCAAGRLQDESASVALGQWDVTDRDAFPFERGFGLVVSSVMAPYLEADELAKAVPNLVTLLSAGGVLAFIEQDLPPRIWFPNAALGERMRDPRIDHPYLPIALRRQMRAAELDLLPRRSFLWIDESYGPYLRGLLPRAAADVVALGKASREDADRWLRGLEELADHGEFHYSLLYHQIAGRMASYS